MKKKHYLWVTAIVISLLLAGGGVAYYLLQPVRSIQLVIPWNNQYYISVVQSLLEEYEDKHPKVSVTVTGSEISNLNEYWQGENQNAHYDLAVSASVPHPSKLSEGTLYKPWTGYVWSLYYNRTQLEKAGWSKQVPESFINGSAGIGELEQVFKSLSKEGVIPMSVGAKYAWPLAALIQHIALSETAYSTGFEWSSEEKVPEQIETATARYESWLSRVIIFPTRGNHNSHPPREVIFLHRF
ncbi:MAG: hypothetical protein K9L66_12590 [Spirochaetaceae bacterium]|nr:hypothetical protein [Spirochaetaceae bacterium]